MSGETAAERQKRMAQALRANLRKRKTQTRERASDQASQDPNGSQDAQEPPDAEASPDTDVGTPATSPI